MCIFPGASGASRDLEVDVVRPRVLLSFERLCAWSLTSVDIGLTTVGWDAVLRRYWTLGWDQYCSDGARLDWITGPVLMWKAAMRRAAQLIVSALLNGPKHSKRALSLS